MSQIVHIPTCDIKNYLPKLIELRAITYQEFPYLYEQNPEDEQEYVTQYTNSNAILIAESKENQITGMIIGIPLLATQEWIKEAFSAYKKPLNDIFYIGDIVTSTKEEKMKQELLNAMESLLKEKATFSTITLCEVYRNGHPQENATLNAFWQNLGYKKQDHLKSTFWWKDIDQQGKTPKDLIYWTKQI